MQIKFWQFLSHSNVPTAIDVLVSEDQNNDVTTARRETWTTRRSSLTPWSRSRPIPPTSLNSSSSITIPTPKITSQKTEQKGNLEWRAKWLGMSHDGADSWVILTRFSPIRLVASWWLWNGLERVAVFSKDRQLPPARMKGQGSSRQQWCKVTHRKSHSSTHSAATKW